MTNQMQGEILFRGWEGGEEPEDEGEWAHTPWMPVRGDFATFGVEVLAMTASTPLGWDVQTRTAEDPTPTTVLSSFQSATSTGVHQVLNPVELPCKQMVRYRFRTQGAASTSLYVIFRALMPSWQTPLCQRERDTRSCCV